MEKNMVKRIVILLLFPAVLISQTTEQENVWEPFRCFIGNWESVTTGKAGEGKGERLYKFIMNENYLLSKNKTVFAPQQNNPNGEIHEDWTIFSYDVQRQLFVLRQFNSEGYVNQFVLDSLSADNKTIVFTTETTENAPAGMRARLSFFLTGENEFLEKFELAPNEKKFTMCIQNTWTRKSQLKK